jgi:hypothetical protein
MARSLSLFLAERYVPAGSLQLVAADVASATRVSAELAAEGADVRLLSSTLVPEDETCFALFAANSPEDVRALLERAELPYHRVVEAVQIAVAA